MQLNSLTITEKYEYCIYECNVLVAHVHFIASMHRKCNSQPGLLFCHFHGQQCDFIFILFISMIIEIGGGMKIRLSDVVLYSTQQEHLLHKVVILKSTIQ